ncbi:lipopolysaccharide export system permease protein [Thiogranum longum]|uniref:Lipopolysaccharide export system permease protein LptF n=1 Tax=Thiogranum longum TaxID=1537524 RepID=A0A4R1HAM8_9GAMM|nr:LPS export ABC transporter permease LptF [Thiogranum longum]TCK19007.1 lipopolysaccharide export system permease protein [Thiogranum longum]
MSCVMHRYLGRELLRYWLAFTLVLWLVLLAARFSLYLGQAASGRIPADTVLWLLGLKSVGIFVFLLPLTLFLALLWLLGRLNHDSEALALAASGVGPWQWYRAFAAPALLVALLVAVLSAWLVPQTAAQGYHLRAAAEQRLDASALAPGHFNFLRGGKWTVYARRTGTAPGSLEGIFIHVDRPSRPQVLVAQRASVETDKNGRYLVLGEGYQYDGRAGQSDYRRLHFKDYRIRLDPSHITVPDKQDAVPTPALIGDSSPAARAELAMRVARPVSVLVLALIAVPLARYRPAASRYTPLWLGLLLFAVYFNLLGVGHLWIEQGRLPAALGLWWVHAVVLALAAVVVFLHRRFAP